MPRPATGGPGPVREGRPREREARAPDRIRLETRGDRRLRRRAVRHHEGNRARRRFVIRIAGIMRSDADLARKRRQGDGQLRRHGQRDCGPTTRRDSFRGVSEAPVRRGQPGGRGLEACGERRVPIGPQRTRFGSLHSLPDNDRRITGHDGHGKPAAGRARGIAGGDPDAVRAGSARGPGEFPGPGIEAQPGREAVGFTGARSRKLNRRRAGGGNRRHCEGHVHTGAHRLRAREPRGEGVREQLRGSREVRLVIGRERKGVRSRGDRELEAPAAGTQGRARSVLDVEEHLPAGAGRRAHAQDPRHRDAEGVPHHSEFRGPVPERVVPNRFARDHPRHLEDGLGTVRDRDP